MIKSSLTGSFILYLVSLLFYYGSIIVSLLPILFLVCVLQSWGCLLFISLNNTTTSPQTDLLLKANFPGKVLPSEVRTNAADSLFCKVCVAGDDLMACVCTVLTILALYAQMGVLKFIIVSIITTNRLRKKLLE